MRSSIRVISIILLVAWMGTIFFFSHQPAEESTQMSGEVIEIIAEKVYPDYEDLSIAEKEEVISDYQFTVRKGTHVAAFALLGFLSFLTFISYVKLRFFTRVFLSVYLSLAYAAADEYHQSFVWGRSCEFRDFLLDSAGAVAMILLCTIFVKLIPSLRRKTAFAKVAPEQGIDGLIDLSESLDNISESPRVNIEPMWQEAPEFADDFYEEEDFYSESESDEELTDEAPLDNQAEEADDLDYEEDLAAWAPETEEFEDFAESEDDEQELSQPEESVETEEADISEQEENEALEEDTEESEVFEDEVEEFEVLEPVQEPESENEPEPEPEIEPETEIEPEPEPEISLPQTRVKPKFEMSEEMKYAAAQIGAAVVAVTKVCNKLTLDEQDSTRKELVNLALGRTEVLKAEILRITNLQIPFDEKKNLIEKETQDAYDYFDSIIAQIS